MKQDKSGQSPTLLDIARHAGVSPATVSRVLNNSAPVSEETRGRVFASIAVLGYKHAESFNDKEAAPGTIALLITDILNPFFPEIVRGVVDVADLYGLATLLYNIAEDPLHEKKILRELQKRRLDGIIVCASHISASDLVELYEESHIPLVVINRRIDHPHIPSIFVDLENAAYRSAQHLLGLHHTRIGFLTDHGFSELSHARRRGVVQALDEAGLALPPEWCPASLPSLEGGFQAMSALLSLPTEKRPTAIISYNDLMALGALHAIRTYGLHVPDDISVVGCDGITVAAHSNPPLTTIDQPKYRMGQLAMQTLWRMLDERYTSYGGYTLMESPLVIRESTGPCPLHRPDMDTQSRSTYLS